MRRALMLTTCLAFSFSAASPSVFAQTVEQKQKADSKKKAQQAKLEQAGQIKEAQNQADQKRAQEILATARKAGEDARGFFQKLRGYKAEDTQEFFSSIAEALNKEENQTVKRLVLTQLAKDYGNHDSPLPKIEKYEKTVQAVTTETANLVKEISSVKKGALTEPDKQKIKEQITDAVRQIEMTAARVKEHDAIKIYQKPQESKLPEIKSAAEKNAKERVDALTKKWGGRTENTMTGYAAHAYIGFYKEAMDQAKKIPNATERDLFLDEIKKKHELATKDNTPLREWGKFSSPEAKTEDRQKITEALMGLKQSANVLSIEDQQEVLKGEKENIEREKLQADLRAFSDDVKSLQKHLVENVPLRGESTEAKNLSNQLNDIKIYNTNNEINLESLKKIKDLLDKNQNMPGINSIGLVTKLQSQIEPLENARAIKAHNKTTDKSVNSLGEQAASLRKDASVSQSADALKATAIIESVLGQKKNNGYIWKADAYAQNYQTVVDKLGAETPSVQRAVIEQLEASAKGAKLGNHKKKVEDILNAKRHELHLAAAPVTAALEHQPLGQPLVKVQEKLFHPEENKAINLGKAPYQVKAEALIQDVKTALDKSGKTDFKAYTRFYEEIEKKIKEEPDQAVRLQAQLLAGNELRKQMTEGTQASGTEAGRLYGWTTSSFKWTTASKDAQEKVINEFGGKTAPEDAAAFAQEHIKKLEAEHHAKAKELQTASAVHATRTHQAVETHGKNMAKVHESMQKHLEINHSGNTQAREALDAIKQAQANMQAQIAEHAQARTLMTKEQTASHIATLQAARAHFENIPNDAGDNGHKAAMLAQHEALIAALQAHQEAIENHNEHMANAVTPHSQAHVPPATHTENHHNS